MIDMTIKTKLKKLVIQTLRENKDEYETDYVEYVRDLPGEEPFLMGNKKYQYVLAKYPSGKLDIGVYAFSGDVVHGYNYFRRMYGINETVTDIPDPKKQVFFTVRPVDLSAGSRDPDAEREIVYQIFRVTTDALGDDYNEVQVGGRDYYRKEEADAVAYELNKKIGGMNLNETVERFSKTVTGTVNVNGEEFDYVATVSGNVVGTPQPHGEFHSEIDESSIDIDIEHVKPQPEDEQWKAIDSAVYDDVMGKNLWDLVNEIQSFTMPKPEVKPEKTINITGKKCIRCKKGTYGETSIHNDIEGTKSCSSCGHTLPTNSTKDDLLKERNHTILGNLYESENVGSSKWKSNFEKDFLNLKNELRKEYGNNFC